ncbi:MAG TPA: hypothetical protein VLG50_04250 [Candidatus Saccharimonadales bacterium]|nr:hypothetical protein [Candidatus Saccharimonadales bacterium]
MSKKNMFIIMFIMICAFSFFNCLGSHEHSISRSSSLDCLDDYVGIIPCKDQSIYPIPQIPAQTTIFDPGQSYGDVLRQASDYVFPHVCTVMQGLKAYKDTTLLHVAREIANNAQISCKTLLDYRGMQGDSAKSVAELIHEGKLVAAVQYSQACTKQKTQSYQEKAYEEIHAILEQLREHECEIHRALWNLYEKKIQKNKDLLGNLFAIVKTLETGKLKSLQHDTALIDLLQETQAVLASIYNGNIIFVDRVSQEETSFAKISDEIRKSVAIIEANIRKQYGTQAAVAC